MVTPNPYMILGVGPEAEPEVIDAAYRALMKKYHPDTAGPAGLEKAKAITLAYAALKERTSEPPTDARGADTEQQPKSTREPEPEWRRWHVDYVPTPPLRIGVRLGFAMLTLFGVPLLGAAILKFAGG